MEFERKSERNQQLCERYKIMRKQRRAMRPKIPAPRFGRGIKVPMAPEGMELHKFYGEPVFLPVRLEGEELVGKMPYTLRQIEALTELGRQRENKYSQGNIIKTFGIYID